MEEEKDITPSQREKAGTCRSEIKAYGASLCELKMNAVDLGIQCTFDCTSRVFQVRVLSTGTISFSNSVLGRSRRNVTRSKIRRAKNVKTHKEQSAREKCLKTHIFGPKWEEDCCRELQRPTGGRRPGRGPSSHKLKVGPASNYTPYTL